MMGKKIVSEIEVEYNPIVKTKDREKVKSSGISEKIIRPFYGKKINHKEQFFIILLDNSNGIIGVHKISEGGITSTIVDPILVFQTALLCNAKAIILSHNHPSGKLKPSEEDLKLTKRLSKGAEILGLSILDHLILTEDSYYSFADNGEI